MCGVYVCMCGVYVCMLCVCVYVYVYVYNMYGVCYAGECLVSKIYFPVISLLKFLVSLYY